MSKALAIGAFVAGVALALTALVTHLIQPVIQVIQGLK